MLLRCDIFQLWIPREVAQRADLRFHLEVLGKISIHSSNCINRDLRG
jgi:hypothetical protein